MKKETNILTKLIGNLDSQELKALSDQILSLLKSTENEPHTDRVEKVECCRKCAGTNIVKFGKDSNGKQRYKCRACGCTFVSTSFSVISHSHCSFDVWEQYIDLMFNGASLKKCAAKCGISIRTAFLWRHKILNVLQRDQDNKPMNGIVELDDMFLPISYKGNHKNSKRFSMPRKAYKRGTDNKHYIGHMACVMCAVERKGSTYGEVLGVGIASQEMLSHAFADRLLEDTIVVSDKAANLKKYFSDSGIEHIQISAHSDRYCYTSSPEIKGVYHIQSVNCLHARFRRFLRVYNGVSTKYLNHYLNLFVWMENHRENKQFNLMNELRPIFSQAHSHITSSYIISMPAIPKVA